MTPLCRRHFEINFNEWKLVILIKLFCSTATHDLGYHMSRAVVTQVGQLRPIWLTLANLMGKLQTTFFRWKCLNSDWYYIEIYFKGVIYNKSALVQLITWCRASDRPLSESMLTQPLTHIYAALWGNVLKENRVSKVRQKSLFAHMKSANVKSFIGQKQNNATSLYRITRTGALYSIWLNKTSLTIDDHLLWLA